MSRWSVRGRTVALTAAIAVLATGCAQEIPGLGTYSSGRGSVGDAKVTIENTDKGEIDRIAGNAVSDIQKFWTEEMPDSFKEKYEPVKAVYSIDPDGSVAAPCTDDASDIRGNAFYCPSQDIVAWDRKGLFPQLQSQFGDFLVAMVLAHEWGHAIQKRTKAPSNRTIVLETQADCYAGAWTAYALKGGAPHFEIDRPVLDQALSGYLLFRDPLGSDADDRQAHGSGFDRISGFQDGFEKGVTFCADFDDSRTFTQAAFTSQTDQQNQGNLSVSDTLRQGPVDVDAYWSASYQTLYGQAWKDLAGGTKSFGDSSRPQCSGQEVLDAQYCAADDTVYYSTDALSKVYKDTQGDFGAISLVAISYGYAVQQRRGRSTAVDSESVLLAAICATGGYAKDSYNQESQTRLRLSPGDLDEAIRALLDAAGSPNFTKARGTTGFDRVQAFREGFQDPKSC
jgi:predicted metalloprotease